MIPLFTLLQWVVVEAVSPIQAWRYYDEPDHSPVLQGAFFFFQSSGKYTVDPGKMFTKFLEDSI